MQVQQPSTETVMAIVRDATAAPSLYNAQPWRFRYLSGSRTFHLRCDPDRAVPRSDPTGRALHLGCGAALFNLRVSAAHAGWSPLVRLLPDPEDRELLAVVRLAEPGHIDRALAGLHSAIHRRHTSRHPFTGAEVPADVRLALTEAARREGAELVFPSPWHTSLLLDLVRDAEGHNALDPGAAEEVARWTRIGAAADTATDGIPDYAFGPRKLGGKAPVRDFAGRRPVPGRPTAAFEDTPTLALLGTPGDRRGDWLAAGQAMERVLLTATEHGLATSLTSHPLEQPELRRLVRDPLTTVGHVQMVFRLGYGPPGPATPRRPVQEVLEID